MSPELACYNSMDHNARSELAGELVLFLKRMEHGRQALQALAPEYSRGGRR
jgi:hypothetical protein